MGAVRDAVTAPGGRIQIEGVEKSPDQPVGILQADRNPQQITGNAAPLDKFELIEVGEDRVGTAKREIRAEVGSLGDGQGIKESGSIGGGVSRAARQAQRISHERGGSVPAPAARRVCAPATRAPPPAPGIQCRLFVGRLAPGTRRLGRPAGASRSVFRESQGST